MSWDGKSWPPVGARPEDILTRIWERLDEMENHVHSYYTDDPHDEHGKDEHDTTEPVLRCNKVVAWGGPCPKVKDHEGWCS